MLHALFLPEILYGLTLLIGLLLGLLGGGGSVLLVPLLVFYAGMDAKDAVALGLIAVGSTSLVAMLGYARRGLVCWHNGAAFGGSGMLGAFLGARVAAHLPMHLVLIFFSLMMLGTALHMIARQASRSLCDGPQKRCPPLVNLPAIILDGFLVGFVTGVVGVGGGFVIVPALSILGRLPLPSAIGTSLLIVSMNATAALLGYDSPIRLPIETTGIIVLSMLVGAALGGRFSNRVKVTVLRRLFGLLVAFVGCSMLYRELSWQRLEEIQTVIALHHEFLLGLTSAFGVMLLYWIRGLLHTMTVNRERLQ